MKKNSLTYINENASENVNEFIAESESRFDAAVDRAVDGFLSNENYDIVMLAGPSSSGKTTTAGKIAEKIRSRGKNAYTVSLDDFYLNRADIPMGDDGLADFESVYALDIALIQETFSKLITEREADLPFYDFGTGTRKKETKHIKLQSSDVLVVEGLHALNPVITEGLDAKHLYKMYISVSSRVFDDDGSIVFNKRNLRLVRRIIRDAKHRGTSAEDTLMRWQSVLNGEDRYLFPFESYADIKVDSFHPYEPCIFRGEVLKQLDTVEKQSPYYEKARELRSAFDAVEEINPSFLPENSLLCEFLR